MNGKQLEFYGQEPLPDEEITVAIEEGKRALGLEPVSALEEILRRTGRGREGRRAHRKGHDQDNRFPGHSADLVPQAPLLV